MITIFTIPKPFTDPHIRTIQRNAIQSWKELGSAAEIFLLGNDQGVAEVAVEFGVKHIPHVELSQWGTPLISSAFGLVREQTDNELLMYVNADIMFTKDLLNTLPHLPKNESLMVGKRQDLDVTEEIDFENPSWENDLRKKVAASGVLHSPAGIDYFIFRRQSYTDLPPLIVGRVNWDSWMIWKARSSKLPIIDATQAILAVHQNHDYKKGHTREVRKANPEGVHNDSFIPDRKMELSIAGANYIMDADYSLKKNWRIHWYPIIRILRKIKW